LDDEEAPDAEDVDVELVVEATHDVSNIVVEKLLESHECKPVDDTHEHKLGGNQNIDIVIGDGE
jgi:hypothetical protein